MWTWQSGLVPVGVDGTSGHWDTLATRINGSES